MTIKEFGVNISPQKGFLKLDLVKNSFFIVAAIFLLIVFIKILLSLNFYAPFVVPDEYTYDSNAHLLSQGSLYQYMGAVPPLYQVVLSLAYHVSDDKNVVYHIMLIISCVISTLIIFPAYFILRKFIDLRYAIMGALAITTTTAMNFFSFTLMLENLFIPLVLFAVWALIEAFDTYKISWQIVSGASIACLELTRSLGQIIEYSFILAFVLFLIIKRKSGIKEVVKTQAPMLLSFALIFSTWHILLQMINNIAVSGTAGSIANAGTTYNAIGYLSALQYVFQSYTDLVLSIKIFINHFDYIILSLYLIPIFIIFHLTSNRKGEGSTSAGYGFCLLFIFISTISLVVCVTIIDISLFNPISEIHFALGRYLDPLLPAIFIFGIISVYKAKSSDFKNKFIHYYIFMGSAVLIVVYISTYSLNLAFDPSDYTNNPSLTYLFITNYWIYPLVILAISIFSVIFLYIAAVDKRFITILLLLIIVASVFSSYLSYNLITNGSEKLLRNDISQYLHGNSNDQTLILIDKNLTGIDFKMAQYAFNFWNDGKSSLIDINDSNVSALLAGNNVYLVTTANLSYKTAAIDNRLKLFYNSTE